jgi:hypothetical protein
MNQKGNEKQPKVKNMLGLIKNSLKNQAEENVQLKAVSILNPVDESYILNLQIIPPDKMTRPQRKPISLVCILDTSDSMNIDAVKDAKGNESHGFSRLDLVRHSMNTLI